MSYKDKPQVKLYKFENNAFILDAIIDDFQDISFECNRYRAGQFTITINYNIPNALLFERGLWVQIGDNPYNFGEILNVTDAVGQDGKGSQIRTIAGYDARYIFKRRVIKNLNNESNWVMTAKGEICMRSLILDQCGANAESKRQLPVENIIPSVSDAIGKEYSVAESFSNLYEVLCTIATQSEIGWRVKFSGVSLSLEFYQGEDRRDTVRFDTSFESLAQGQFTDSAESFANSVYVGGKGTGSDRDIYEGENGSPEGLDRFEAWDNQSGMTTEDEYEAEALSMLTQYSQTLTVSGQGLAKNPYVYGEQYNVGDIITIAFSGKSAAVQILSVTEHWAWGSYNIEFSFGKPQPDLNNQLQLILKQIQKASDKTSTTDSVKWYTIPTDTAMPSADVVYNTIGFVGTCAGGGSTFTLYLDDEKTGAKTYHVYLKQLAGGSLTLTTGKAGASDLVLNSGTYVAIIYIDENGNVTSQGSTAVNAVQSGNLQPVTSDAVYNAISGFGTVTGVKGNAENTYRTGNVNLTPADIGAGTVMGVKGNAESTYRTGNVNLTPANIGAATSTDITNAIQALDVSSAGGSGKYISAISETDGKISATATNLATSIANGGTTPPTGGAVYTELLNYGKTLGLSGTSLSLKNGDTSLSSVTLGKSNVGLGNVDNTADANKKVFNASSANSVIATCSTLAGTAAKAASLSGYRLTTGSIFLWLDNSNTSAGALTLNVNATGAKTIYYNDTVTSSSNYKIHKGLHRAYYNGTYWYLYPILNMETGTSWNGGASSITNNIFGGAIGAKAWYFSTSKSYIKFTNGLIIQWGLIAKGSNLAPDGKWTVSCNIISTTNVVYFGASLMSGGSLEGGPEYTWKKVSTTQVQCLWYNRNGSVTITSPSCSYLVIGY